MVAAPAGYSGKPLWQKLGLKAGQRLFIADPPADLAQLLSGAPEGIARIARLAEFDVGNCVRHEARRTGRGAGPYAAEARPGRNDLGGVAEQASGAATDVTEDTVRDVEHCRWESST